MSDLINKCPECEREGKKSYLHGGDSGISTYMATSHYFDPEGIEHWHDPNSLTRHYNCSNGHTFARTTYSKCPNCDFGAGRGQSGD